MKAVKAKKSPSRLWSKDSWLTTVISIPIFLYGFYLLGGDIYGHIKGCCPGLDVPTAQIVSVLALGYTFLRARNTLVDGVTVGTVDTKKLPDIPLKLNNLIAKLK